MEEDCKGDKSVTLDCSVLWNYSAAPQHLKYTS